MASSCADGLLRIWELETGKPIILGDKDGNNDGEPVTGAFIDRYATWVVASSFDGNVRVWKRGEPDSRAGPWYWKPGVDSDVDRILGLTPDVPLVDTKQQDAEPFRFTLHRKLPSHRGAVLSLGWREGTYTVATGSFDGTIRVWDFAKGRELHVLPGHKSWVNSLDFTRAGDRLVSASSDGTINIWSGGELSVRTMIDVSKAEIRSVKFSPDGQWLACGLRYGEAQLRNANTGELKLTLKAHDGDCWAVRFSPDGQTLITGGGDWGKPGAVNLWDVNTGKLRGTLKHSGEVLCVAVSLDGRRLAAGGGDGVVKVWDSTRLTRPERPQREPYTVRHEDWVSSAASDSVGRIFITGGADGHVRIWNWETGELVSDVPVSEEVVSSVAIHPDAWTFAAGSYDGSIRVWNFLPARDQIKKEVTPIDADKAVRLQRLLPGHRGAVTGVAFHGRSSVLTTCSVDGTLKLWNNRDEKKSETLVGHKSWVNSVDYSRRWDLLASGSSDGTVKIWNSTFSQNVRESISVDVTKSEVRSVSLSPDGWFFACGLRYGDVQLRSVSTGELKWSFKAHDGDCWAVRFSPDGQTLITGGGDWGKPGEVKLWDAKTGDLRTTLKHSGEVLCVTLSPDGRRLAAGGGDGAIKVWDVDKLIGIDPR